MYTIRFSQCVNTTNLTPERGGHHRKVPLWNSQSRPEEKVIIKTQKTTTHLCSLLNNNPHSFHQKTRTICPVGLLPTHRFRPSDSRFGMAYVGGFEEHPIAHKGGCVLGAPHQSSPLVFVVHRQSNVRTSTRYHSQHLIRYHSRPPPVRDYSPLCETEPAGTRRMCSVDGSLFFFLTASLHIFPLRKLYTEFPLSFIRFMRRNSSNYTEKNNQIYHLKFYIYTSNGSEVMTVVITVAILPYFVEKPLKLPVASKSYSKAPKSS